MEATNLQQENDLTDLTDIDKSRKMTLISKATLSPYHMNTNANFFFRNFRTKKKRCKEHTFLQTRYLQILTIKFIKI